MSEKFINISFPFMDDNKGKFLAMNSVSKQGVKSDLIHLLLTNKGERLYLPNYGANLRQYLFEPNGEEVQNNIKNEIQKSISDYIPNLIVDEIVVEAGKQNEIRNEHHVLVTISYTVTDGVFKQSDLVKLEL